MAATVKKRGLLGNKNRCSIEQGATVSVCLNGLCSHKVVSLTNTRVHVRLEAYSLQHSSEQIYRKSLVLNFGKQHKEIILLPNKYTCTCTPRKLSL